MLERIMREGRRRTVEHRHDRDTEILKTWLARHEDTFSRVDLDSFIEVDDAIDALRDAAKAVLDDASTMEFR